MIYELARHLLGVVSTEARRDSLDRQPTHEIGLGGTEEAGGGRIRGQNCPVRV